MQTNKILSAELIDIIFDGRNKAYGAYELRKAYSKRIGRALLVTGLIVFIAVGGVALANSSKKETAKYNIRDSVTITDITPPPEKLPEPEHPQQQEQVRTEIFVELRVADNDNIETPPPTQEELSTAAIGSEQRDGTDDNGMSSSVPQNIDNGTGIVEQPATSEETFTIVEIEAKFIGNWKAFLERNLNANVPTDNGAPAGRYSVVIQFVVDKEGNVSDIQTLTKHGYGLEEEALRVLRKAPKWEPAIQNGIRVKAYRKQVITFEVNEEG
jgi:protein TonB